MANEIFEAAKRYCEECRFSIIPVQGKKPMIKWTMYQKNAARMKTVEEWFNVPDPPNIALVLGSLSGVWAIDCDDQDAVKWLEERLPFPAASTRVALTRRGRHYYFRLPPSADVKSRNLRHLNGLAVEFRAEGNVIVLPPSKRKDCGFTYSWLSEPDWSEIPELDPAYFSQYFEELKPDEPPARKEGGPLNVRQVREGERNDYIFRLTCKNVSAGVYSRKDLQQMTMAMNQAFCDPPLPESELRSVFNSAMKYFKGEPATALAGEIIFPEKAVIDSSGMNVLQESPEPFNWVFEGSLLTRQLGMVFGPPGCGKGLFSAALTASLASGTPLFDAWTPVKPFRVMLMSIEDTMQILHHRMHAVLQKLDPAVKPLMDLKVCSLRGRTSLAVCERGIISKTDFYDEFVKQIDSYRPEVLILDTLVRFIGGDENNNNLMNAMFEILENLSDMFKCNIIVVHHSAKRAGDVLHSMHELTENMSQTSVRGASSIAGALRWILQMAPVSGAVAGRILGRANDMPGPDGTYVVTKVVKKNMGPPEESIVLCKDGGFLTRHEPTQEKDQLIEECLSKLIEEIDRLDADGEAPISAAHPEEQLGWNYTLTQAAMLRGLERGLLVKVKNENRNGFHLETPAPF